MWFRGSRPPVLSYMLLLSHTTAAILIGQVTPNPWLAFIFSFVAHLGMDMIPHGDTHQYHRYKKRERVRRAVAFVMLDSIAAIALVAMLWTVAPPLYALATIAAIVGGILPDLIVACYDLGRVRWLKPFHDFHFRIHFLFTRGARDLRLPVGVGLQLLVLALLRNRLFW